jgi:protein TonB
VTTLDLDPSGPAPAWGQRPRPLALVGIGVLHIAVFWLVLQMDVVREAAEHMAPLVVQIVQADRPLPPAETLPLPLPLPRPLPLPQPPVPQVVPTVEWTPTPPVAAPARPTPPPVEAVVAIQPQPSPAAVVPRPERQVAITEVSYLTPPVLLYPRTARRLREEGLVQVRVRVDEQGRPERYVIVRSSGHALLDEAALETVRATRFKPYAENGVAQPFWVVMPLLFEIQNH